MKKYKISYSFDGQGEVMIDAKSEEEAIEKFHEGDYAEEEDEEWGEYYNIEEVNCIDEEDLEAEQGEKAKQDALEQANKSLIN